MFRTVVAQNIEYIDMFNIIVSGVGAKKIKHNLPNISYYPLVSIATLMEKINSNSRLTSEVLFFSFRYRYFDFSKAKKELGWVSKKDLDAAVKEAVGFYEKRDLI